MKDFPHTERLAARIVLAEGTVITGEVHLQPRVAWRDGPETVLEMLNHEDPFFAVSLPEGQAIFVAKAQVAALAHDVTHTADEDERRLAARELPLHVFMAGGQEHIGIVVSELPPAHGRVLDFLNLHERCFELVTDKGTICLNRRHVRAVRPRP